MDARLVGIIPCVLDFLDLDSHELLAAGILTDSGDESVLAGFFTQHTSKFRECENGKANDASVFANIATLPPDDFRSYFRMSYPMFCDLLSALTEHTSFGVCEGKKKMNKSNLETHLMLTLHYLGSLRSSGELAACFEINEASFMAKLKLTVSALYELMQLLISWPDKKQIQTIVNGFQKLTRIPNVLGAIDVTHINLQTTDADEKFYLNVKGQPTILLQAVCDHQMRFMHCCTGWPGSVDDISVLHDSDLFQDVKENQAMFFPDDCILVGDQAYPLYPWLFTPFEGNETTLDDKKLQYNFYVGVAHDIISKAFLHMRRRFPRLEKLDALDLEDVVKIILVTCALHNFCIDQGDTELFTDTMVSEEKINTIAEPDVRFVNIEAVAKRERLSQSL